MWSDAWAEFRDGLVAWRCGGVEWGGVEWSSVLLADPPADLPEIHTGTCHFFCNKRDCSNAAPSFFERNPDEVRRSIALFFDQSTNFLFFSGR